jgi:folylpolyglutamate synthase/dihydropteroate synthase
MNFQRSLDYLNSFFNLEKIFLDSKNRDLNLDRMAFLIKLFDRPDEFFLPIIIAGTKGKVQRVFSLSKF